MFPQVGDSFNGSSVVVLCYFATGKDKSIVLRRLLLVTRATCSAACNQHQSLALCDFGRLGIYAYSPSVSSLFALHYLVIVVDSLLNLYLWHLR